MLVSLQGTAVVKNFVFLFYLAPLNLAKSSWLAVSRLVKRLDFGKDYLLGSTGIDVNMLTLYKYKV